MKVLIPETADRLRRRDILFGTGANRVNGAVLSEKTGINQGTVNSWRREPGRITLEGAVKIAKARHLSEAQILALFKEGR